MLRRSRLSGRTARRLLEPDSQLVDGPGELGGIESDLPLGEHAIGAELGALKRAGRRRFEQPEVDLRGRDPPDAAESQFRAAGKRDHLLVVVRTKPQQLFPAGLQPLPGLVGHLPPKPTGALRHHLAQPAAVA